MSLMSRGGCRPAFCIAWTKFQLVFAARHLLIPIGEATRGHYAAVHALVQGIRAAGAAITTEPQGLSDTPSRLADILTSAAVPGRSAALDVCVASPNAAAAGSDAAEAAFRRKPRHYEAVTPQLHRAGIAFRPMVWTADG